MSRLGVIGPVVPSKPRRKDLCVGLLILGVAFAASPAFSIPSGTLITLTGAAANDQLGVSVSGAGDVNGDGYADVIVGAYLNGAGRAYVYYGGSGSDATADLTLTGEAAGDNFGFSVSAAGDVNGDGYADVIVGATQNDANGFGAGRAYVYYGGPGADAIADLTLTGAAANDNFGYSVSGAGDLNGDGYGDVIVGAVFNDAGGAEAGRAYVYYGGLGADAVADLTLTGAAAGDYFGFSVSTAGDVNGDGYADVIVGATQNDAGGSNAGRAYVYYGGPGPDAIADLTLTGAAAGDFFGVSVSAAGDVNGDGYADVIVGAYLNGAGRAYVYYGGPGTDATADLTLAGEAAGEGFGRSVSDAGDVNGDGYADVIVGAYLNDAGGADAGRAYVYYGGPGADAIADLTPTGEVALDNLGSSVSAAGDVNGDGYAGVIVGVPFNDAAGPSAGRAYVITSRPYEVLSPNGGEQWVAGTEVTVRWLGLGLADIALSTDGGLTYATLVSGVGGAPDNRFVVTAPFSPSEGAKVRVSESGRPATHMSSDVSDGVFSIVLPHDPPAAAARLLLSPTGAAAGDFFGYSVSGAGDVNGDGYADVIVGAYLNDAGSSDAGRAYVYYGGPGADAVADLTLTGAGAGDRFGYSVSGTGDVNGDGYADVIVGAYWNDAGGADAGRAYVYYGGPGADAVADLTLTGAAANDQFGFSVSGAGDVNGDGYADVIVGAYFNDAGGVDAGRAYVYYGGPGADAVADLTLTGAAAGDFFGSSVSGAGDVNGDGNADVIVGAYAGGAYVYYGGPGADAVADLTLTGAAAFDRFGFSVSGAGDVNGDGYADVIVGAYFNDAGGVDAGRAYVYYGGPGADAVADLTLTGAAAFDNFGVSVSTAGDVNGDGYGDVIVGAAGGGVSAGRTYLYDCNRYFVTAPNGGETWNVGVTKTISWLGAEPADVWLSVDGGDGDERLAAGVGGAAVNAIAVRVPHFPTKFARIVLRPSDASIEGGDASDGVFRIVVPHDPPAAAARLLLSPTGAAADDELGYSVSSAGDVNGDGYADVIVGAPFNDAAGASAGRAYVYYGGPGADNIADLTLSGAAAGDYFGYSVSSTGDVNGDGYSDVIVGASQYAAGTGRAYVYYGGPGADAVADLTLLAVAAGDNFGTSVSGAGDVNRDGYADVIVGAPLNDAAGADAGQAYVFYGGPAANTVADLILTGAAALDQFGFSVSGAGDVNGDGYADVLVGAPLNDAGGADAGRAYVYNGGAQANAAADLILTGGEAGGYLGVWVSGGGDIDGDGYVDVAVGAPLNDAGGPGRVYVYYGGPGADGLADLTLTGATAGDWFGLSVSSSTDVNGDGYGDVFVGAPLNSAGATNAGRAYVFYGGPGADAVADLTLAGAAAFDNFGYSVSTAADMKGDGYAVVIVGAPLNDAGGPNGGRAYLYDMNRYFLTVPNGGETWNVGATRSISWLGAEPADVWLSADGGNTHELVESAVGGLATNTLTIRVPHTPTKFARIKITPSNAAIGGFDRSDSLFTIQTSVALLSLLAAPAPDRTGAAVITWDTDPGPEDLAGYRLEKSRAGAGAVDSWQTLVSLTKEKLHVDGAAGGGGARYRLFAVNGLGEELMLGETSLRPLAPLAAWPLPYRGGELSISFATRGGLGGGAGSAEVSLYDASGRLVRTVARGQYPAGYQSAVWDGRDARGKRVAAGIYFLRVASEGKGHAIKFVVLH